LVSGRRYSAAFSIAVL
jgi:hypothetical protein